MKYEKIIEMMEGERIEAVQQDAFYWGYMVAMKQLKKAGVEE